MNEFKKENPKNSKKLKEIRDFVIVLVITVVATFFIRNYVFARADVDGESMQSTLLNKDVLFEEKICLFTHEFKRTEIVTFDSNDPNHEIYVKRIIGLEEDTIEIKNGKVFRNGTELKEDYLNSGVVTMGDTFLHENQKYTVPKGCIFVMGDNRGYSKDSRTIGPVKIKDIKGHVIIRAYPFKDIKTF